MIWYVYIYEDPRTCVPRYVGKGKGNRATRHKLPGARSNKQLKHLLQTCASEGLDPVPMIIECASEQAAFAVERFWIKVIGRKDLGTGSLFNHTDGGDGRAGFITSEETKMKISRSLSGSNHPAYGKTGTQCPNFGKKRTVEQNQHLSKVLTGKKQDPEVVAARAATNTGKKRSAEQCANIKAGLARYHARKHTNV